MSQATSLQEEAVTSLFGSDKADVHDDEEIALELYHEQLRSIDQVALDDAIAFSLHEAAFQRLLRQEEDFDSEDEALYELVSKPSELEEKPTTKCSCCLEPLEDQATRRVLPCAHIYCLECVATRCRMGIRDRALVPAQCCKREFPVEYVTDVLSIDEIQVYERYLEEKKKQQSLDLESDKEYASVVESMGGVLCPGCGIGVTRFDGCRQMECICGFEFCIKCGIHWSVCDDDDSDSDSDSDY